MGPLGLPSATIRLWPSAPLRNSGELASSERLVLRSTGGTCVVTADVPSCAHLPVGGFLPLAAAAARPWTWCSKLWAFGLCMRVGVVGAIDAPSAGVKKRFVCVHACVVCA